MKEEKIYCGQGWQNKDWLTNISVCLSDIPEEHISEYNGKKYVKLSILKRKSIGEKGQTHYITVNTYKKPTKTAASIGDEAPF